MIIACRNKSDFSFLIPTSAVNATLFALTAAISAMLWPVQQRRWWCTHGAQPQTRRTSELRSHDVTDRRMKARSCQYIVIPAALRDLSVYSAYHQLPVYLALRHNTLSSPTPYVTHRHTSVDPLPPSSVTSFMDVPLYVLRKCAIHTRCAIKTCHFVSDYNSGVSWAIFTLFVPTETGMNAL